MNYEIEHWEGELAYLREFKDKVDNMRVADVWHEGSKTFYKAHLMYELPEDELIGSHYE